MVFPGSTASDNDGVLINAQEGKTKALRQWRFSSIKEIKVRKIKAYIREAIELQEEGREMKADRSQPVLIPPELKKALAANQKSQAAFKADADRIAAKPDIMPRSSSLAATRTPMPASRPIPQAI